MYNQVLPNPKNKHKKGHRMMSQ